MVFRRVFNALVLRGDWTGVEKAVCGFALDLYNKYPVQGEVVFLVPPGVSIPEIPESFHCHLPWYTRYRAGRIFFELFCLSRLVKKFGPDEFYGPAYLLPRGITCRTTLYIYDLHVYTCPKYCKLVNVAHYRMRMPVSVARADRIIVPSQRVARVLSALFPDASSKTTVASIPLGSLFSKPEASLNKLRLSVRAKWNRYYLAVGSPSPRKNHKAVISAWLSLPKPRPALLITGGIAKPAANESSPEYLGYVPDDMMAALYAEAEALVYPSFDEGYGLPVAEAVAMGTKVITTSEIAEEFDSELITVCGTDSTSIAAAMTRL